MKTLYLKTDNISSQSRQPRVSETGNKGKEKKDKNVFFFHSPQISQVTAGRSLSQFPNTCFQSPEQFCPPLEREKAFSSLPFCPTKGIIIQKLPMYTNHWESLRVTHKYLQEGRVHTVLKKCPKNSLHQGLIKKKREGEKRKRKAGGNHYEEAGSLT